ncbi:MAG: NAD(P)-dependent oxidoreductase [Acidimicrobiales bacterium]|nr:NAD(P)-dependent oxidoreductase [Acidimicrobiales bacterium]
MTDGLRVGFVGLGDQGGPMARRIAESGIPTTLWARRPEALEPFADTGAGLAGSLAELAAASDVLCVCVVDDAGVEEVLVGGGGAAGSLRPGSTVVVHSTVHPDTCRRLAATLAGQDVTVVDAPVSGGGQMAAEGRLVVMVGSDDATLARIRPIVATYGDPILHMGTVGSGQIAKLVNNLAFTANLAVARQLFELAGALDVDLPALARALGTGSARTYGLELLAGLGFELAPLGPVAGPLLAKDVAIVADVARAAGAPVGQLVDVADAALRELGHPRDDR